MTISVVLASCRPAPLMAAAVSRLLPQFRSIGVELIVARVGDSRPDSDAILEGCRLVRCPSGATIPVVRGTGLAAATGDLVLLTEDNCVVRPDWVERLVAGFTPDADVVGGVMANAQSERSIDAAAGFTEYGFYGPFQKAGAVPALACANVAYHRRVVADVVSWSLAGQWEAGIHGRLAQQGVQFRLVTDAVVEQNVQHQVGTFCRNRYQHGRDYAVLRSSHLGSVKRFVLACATPLLPAVLTWRVWRRSGRSAPREFLRALPFTLTFFGAWSAGEAAGYFRGNGAG